METIDFSGLDKKYPLINNEDISFLNRFFNSEKIKGIIEKVTKDGNKKKAINLAVMAIITIVVLLFFIPAFSENKDDLIPTIFGFLLVDAIAIIFGLIILNFFLKNKLYSIKRDILPPFAKSIDSNLKYDSSDKYSFKGDISLLTSCKLLKSYDRIDIIEDSILLEKGWKDAIKENEDSAESSVGIGLEQNPVDLTGLLEQQNIFSSGEGQVKSPFMIEGFELKTSEERRGEKGRRYWVVTNHCYLMKITFNNPKRDFTSGMLLSHDINDNILRKLGKVIAIDAIIIFIIMRFSDKDSGKNFIIDFLVGISEAIGVNVGIFLISLILFMIGVTYHIYSIVINKKRVKTENLDFEKEFDVYCDDQVKSRAVLTPDFMYRIVDFVNQIDKHRVYEMYFKGDSIYIKFDFLKSGKRSYLEFSMFGIKNNLNSIVEFYIEIKNVVSLANKLGLYYFDKDSMKTSVIGVNGISSGSSQAPGI